MERVSSRYNWWRRAAPSRHSANSQANLPGSKWMNDLAAQRLARRREPQHDWPPRGLCGRWLEGQGRREGGLSLTSSC